MSSPQYTIDTETGGLLGRRFSVNGHKALGLNPDTQPETHNTPYSVFKSFSRHQIK